MPVAAILQPNSIGTTRFSRRDGVKLLQAFVIALMVFPSDTVFKPVGAAGYPASLIGGFILVAYAVSVLLGLHHPRSHPHPMRRLLAIVWITLLTSYILMKRGELTGIQIRGADSELIKYAVITGVVLVAAEWLGSLRDVMRVVRAMCWAGAFCAFVSVLQYWLGLDISQYLRQIPGFVINHDNPAILSRGTLNRAAGTAITPIELGVVMGMLIPLAICLALHDRDKSLFKRWGAFCLILLGVAASVSRSAVVSVVIAFVVLLVLLPPVPRLGALAALPLAIGGIFMTAHGLIGTLTQFFTGASDDMSILYRTHDYPVAETVWRAAPWFGHGPGTWRPTNDLNIFDNQWLDAVVELGAIGAVMLLLFLVVPALVALAARRASEDPQLRILCAALAGAGLAAPVVSATFDSMAFPLFVNVYALVIGLSGACARLVAAERGTRTLPPPLLPRVHIDLPRLPALRPRRAET